MRRFYSLIRWKTGIDAKERGEILLIALYTRQGEILVDKKRALMCGIAWSAIFYSGIRPDCAIVAT